MNKPQLSAEMEKRLIGKNVHSVYTRCFVCHSWGVNLPLNHQCGNCNSNETTVYYDIETIAQALATALEEEREKVLSEVEGWLVDEFTEEDEWICPKCGNTVGEGYYCRNDRSKPVKETRKWEDGWQEAKNVLRAELRAKLNQLKGKNDTR